MEQPLKQDVTPHSLWGYIARASRRISKARPASFYLLLVVLLVMVLGVRIVYSRQDPSKFALYLSLFFVFFFAVLVRAIVDFFEILKCHFRERERLFGITLGDGEFAEELGRRVAERRDE